MKKLLLLIAATLSLTSFSGTITSNGTGGGVWSAGGSWLGGIAPVAGDNAIIAAGDVITVGAATAITTVTVTGSISFTAVSTITVSGNLVMNPGSSIDGAGFTGTINVTGTFQAITGGIETIGRLNITINSTSQIDGTLTY